MSLAFLSVIVILIDITTSLDVNDPNYAAVKTGIQELLNSRKNWGWGSYANAEAILGLTLANETWYQKGDSDSMASVEAMHIELLAALSVDNMLRDSHWSHGKLAQYIGALKMTCSDPTNFYKHNLVYILKQHMANNTLHFHNQKFALSWAVLAMCSTNQVIDNSYKKVLTTTTNYTFGIDEASMEVLALTCIKDQTGRQQAENYIVHQLRSGVSANEYTKSLAIQALRAARTSGAEDLLSRMVDELRESLLHNTSPLMTPLGASHILPALTGTSFLDISKTICQEENIGVGNTTSLGEVTFRISVKDMNSSNMWTVTVSNGSTLYEAMLVLQKSTPAFRFQATHSSFGYSVDSINGVTADLNKFMYWQILKNDVPLTESVSGTVPKEGDHFIFRITTWQ